MSNAPGSTTEVRSIIIKHSAPGAQLHMQHAREALGPKICESALTACTPCPLSCDISPTCTWPNECDVHPLALVCTSQRPLALAHTTHQPAPSRPRAHQPPPLALAHSLAPARALSVPASVPHPAYTSHHPLQQPVCTSQHPLHQPALTAERYAYKVAATFNLACTIGAPTQAHTM